MTHSGRHSHNTGKKNRRGNGDSHLDGAGAVLLSKKLWAIHSGANCSTQRSCLSLHVICPVPERRRGRGGAVPSIGQLNRVAPHICSGGAALSDDNRRSLPGCLHQRRPRGGNADLGGSPGSGRRWPSGAGACDAQPSGRAAGDRMRGGGRWCRHHHHDHSQRPRRRTSGG